MGGISSRKSRLVSVAKQSQGHRKKVYLPWRHPLRFTRYNWARAPKDRKRKKKQGLKYHANPFGGKFSVFSISHPLAFRTFSAAAVSSSGKLKTSKKKDSSVKYLAYPHFALAKPKTPKQAAVQPAIPAAKPGTKSQRYNTTNPAIPKTRPQKSNSTRQVVFTPQKTKTPKEKLPDSVKPAKTSTAEKIKIIRFPLSRIQARAKTHSPNTPKSKSEPIRSTITPFPQSKPAEPVKTSTKAKSPSVKAERVKAGKDPQAENVHVTPSKPAKNPKTGKPVMIRSEKQETKVKDANTADTKTGETAAPEMPVPAQESPKEFFTDNTWMISRFSRKKRAGLKVANDAFPPEF